MNATPIMSQPSEMDTDADVVSAGVPCVAVVTPCKATYFKPLYEAFAHAQPAPWRTVMVWPESHDSEHPEELLTPVADNLDICRVGSTKIVPSQNPLLNRNWRERRRRFLPSADMWRTLNRLRPRMMIIQEYSLFSLAGLAYARWQGIPVVTLTEVGQRNQEFFNSRVRLWHGLWSRFVDGIVAACPTAHVPVSGLRLPSIAAYHAVDSRLYQPAVSKPSGGPVVFVYVGQIIPRKGLDLWIAAAKELRTRTSQPFKLRIVGGGEDAWLDTLVREAGLEDIVESPGFLSGEALREAIRSADVFVLPSRQDTYAVVVHEAACLALPMIVSKHAGASEGIVRENENGFVIDPEDCAHFVDVMEATLDADTRKRMSEAARRAGEALSSHARGAELWKWMAANFAPSDAR